MAHLIVDNRTISRNNELSNNKQGIGEGRRLTAKLEKLNRLVEKLYIDWEDLES